jgi:glycosyltransferase involved in cell wall biosynthesis
MKISIVIPAYNEETYIKKCLLSIEQYRTPDLCQVLVVDNASTDATATIAKLFSFVTVLSEPQKGNAHARQMGLMHATGDLVAFLDADSTITENWIQIAMAEFKTDENIVALSGPCVFYDLNNRYSFLVWIYFNIIVIPFSKITNSVALLGNLVIKKDAIIKIGGFDTTIKFYGDDANIIRRLKKVGKVIFRRNFIFYTSARRLNKEGAIKTGFTYIINYCSEKFLHRQITKQYLDIR